MSVVIITLVDTDTGVSIKTDFTPAIGAPCSPAQSAALDIISRTRKAYGLDQVTGSGTNANAGRTNHPSPTLETL